MIQTRVRSTTVGNSAQTDAGSANLFRNYNRTVAVAYGLLILALALFFGYLLNRKMAEEIELARGHVARHAQFFEFVLRASADQLETFRISTDLPEDAADTSAPSILDRPPGSWLHVDAADGRFDLDALPNRDSGGNLVGLGGLRQRSPDFYADLATALRLDLEWSSLLFTLPNAVQARFVSAERFHAVLPWQPASALPFDPQVYTSPIWTLAGPAANPDHTKFWAPVYFAGKDRGLLAPVAAPLYRDQRFIGVLAIDTSIDYLNRINSDFNYPLGLTILVDQRRAVLTHPRLYAEPLEVTATPSLTSALPPDLAADPERLYRLEPGRPTRVEGYLVIRHALVSAPWSLFYLVPMSDLWLRVGANTGAPMVGVLLGLALLIGLTYALTSREFVGPAAKLVRHIAAESNFQPSAIPVVPTGWRPWFEAVTRAFRESTQLVALRQELLIAAEMQRAILPRHWPADPRYALWGTMRPARDVGGDFFDHFALDGAHHGMLVADVSGKGIPAGLFGMVSKTLLRSAATQGAATLGETIAKVNDSLAEDNDNCMFVTLFYARLDPAEGTLDYVNAGHPAPLLIHADGRTAWLPLTGGMALGVMDELAYRAATLRLEPGDLLLMFSDGVTEAVNAAEEEYGTQRLAALFDGGPAPDPRGAVARVLESVDRFAAGVEQADDITCIALHYLGPSARATT